MAALDEIAAYLAAHGIGILPPAANYNLTIGSINDQRDPAIALYTYPGGAPEYVQESYSPISEYPQIQVVTRSEDYPEAEDLCWQAWTLLSAVTNATLSGTKYRSIRPNGSPAFMKRDSNDRVLFYFNATVNKEVTLVPVS